MEALMHKWAYLLAIIAIAAVSLGFSLEHDW